MNNKTPSKIKTGTDPRTLPDYAALREELSKLTHPARPDVNWQYVEKRCLSLFEQNGVELQTAAWFTLARTHLGGLSGLNEGLAILEALICHQWGTLWPQPVHVRMEILNLLSQRLQQQMRARPLTTSDLSLLYRAEQLLASLVATLQRLEPEQRSQLDALRNLLHHNAVRLKTNADITSIGPNIQPGIVLPDKVKNKVAVAATVPAGSLPANTPDEPAKRVYVAQPERQANREIETAQLTPEKKWKSFATGMCTMLVISSSVAWGWHYLHRSDPLQTQLAASLAPLSAPLASEKLVMLRQQAPLPKDLITQTERQLTRLDKLPPDWNIAYASKLTEQAQALWPEKADPLMKQWQQQINISALPTDAMNGWHEGMAQLQALTDKLNRLDGQRGKYLTVSELKSQVFGMLTSFRQTVPVEEQLRLLKQLPEDSLQRQQQIHLVEQRLRAQIYTLAQERQR